MSYRSAAMWLGVALFIAGVIAGIAPVHANDIDCGSVFQPYDSAAVAKAEIADFEQGGTARHPDYAADCASRRGGQSALVIPLMVVGGIAATFVLLTNGRREPQTKAV